jgi:thiosulfate dehydrogenase (quinone) large subunit
VPIPSAKTYAWFLTLLRIYAGLFWLSLAIPKFTHASAFLPPSGSMGVILARALALRGGPIHTFLASIVQPHADIFAQLIRAGELVTGVLLLFGILTRLGGLFGVLLGVSALLSQSTTLISGWSSLEATAIAISAISLVLPTGRIFGIDAAWKRSHSLYDDTPAMPVPPSRPEPQPAANTIETTRGEVLLSPAPAIMTPPVREPGPNGANGGPAFAAPASAGPHVDQGSRQSV